MANAAALFYYCRKHEKVKPNITWKPFNLSSLLSSLKMPHHFCFAPAFSSLSSTLSYSSQATNLFVFPFISTNDIPLHCESSSTPRALNSHQALLHLSLHHHQHPKIVPFLCVSVTLVPSLHSSSVKCLGAVVTYLWESHMWQSESTSPPSLCLQHSCFNFRWPGACRRHLLHHWSSSASQALVIMVHKQ